MLVIMINMLLVVLLVIELMMLVIMINMLVVVLLGLE